MDGTEKVRYNYDPSTLKLTSKVFSNGMKTEYSYDREGRIQGMALRDAAGRIQKAVGYQWNTYGQLATRYLKGFELPEAVFVPVSTTGNLSSGLLVQEYKYDAIGRLIAVECPDAPQLSESYSFDQSGNIVSKTVGGKSVEMTYDLANQLIAKSEQGGEATSFSYDAAGRMTSEAVKGVNVASYTYGYLDKVLSVNRQGSESARFQYDAAGMLVGKEKEGVRENWVWDGISLAARGKEVFVNEAHASGGVPIMASHLENGDDISADFLVNDYLGTTIASTSAESAGQVEGLLVASLGAGGDAAAQDNAGARFTGKPYDADMGAHVFPFRNYRTDIGRWMSSDPAGFPDGPNGHFYAPTPTNGIDPLGLQYVTVSGDKEFTPDVTTDDVTSAVLKWIKSANPVGGISGQIWNELWSSSAARTAVGTGMSIASFNVNSEKAVATAKVDKSDPSSWVWDDDSGIVNMGGGQNFGIGGEIKVNGAVLAGFGINIEAGISVSFAANAKINLSYYVDGNTTIVRKTSTGADVEFLYAPLIGLEGNFTILGGNVEAGATYQSTLRPTGQAVKPFVTVE